MRQVLVLMVLLALPSTASAQGLEEIEARVRELGGETGDLDSRVLQSYRRLAAIELAMRGDSGGARVSITQRNHVGVFHRLVGVTYAIDGQTVFQRSDESGALGSSGELAIHDGAIAPGAHVLSVTMRWVGDGGEVFRYVEGYRFVVRSAHTFVVPDGQRARITLDAFDSPERAYVDRLDVVYVEALDPIR